MPKLAADDKKPIKRKEEVVKKRETDGAERKKKDTETTTQNRSRMSESRSKKEPSKTGEKKTLQTSGLKEKNEIGARNKVEIKSNTKSSTVAKTRKTTFPDDKLTNSLKTVKRSLPETVPKTKEHLSSPYSSGKNVKPKSLHSTPSRIKQNQPQSKNSPYKGSTAQPSQLRTNLQASGDRLKKSSQLKETSSKLKIPSSNKPAQRSSKASAAEAIKHKKIPESSSSKSKTVEKRPEKNVASISEDQLRPFGEIPRSNTFTKDDGTASLSERDTSSQFKSFDYESFPSLVQDNDDDYNYDDDFEDYESDFEDYVESEDSTSETEEEESTSDDDSLDEDEDEIGDGYKNAPSSSKDTLAESKTKSILKGGDVRTRPKESTKESHVEKEKPLTVEEERKLDSGSYDLASIADLKRRKQIQDIRSAIEKENASFGSQINQDKSRLLMEDEGFVEVFSQETSPTFLDTSHLSNEVGLIDFAVARKQQMKQKAKVKTKRRGALLMEMIKLDMMNFFLLDIPSVPYEVYMKCYGRSNTLQIYTQTNEDTINEEVQTDEVGVKSKWTQHPIKYSSLKFSEDLLLTFSQEKLGVGGESTLGDEEEWFPKLHVNSLRLHNFINSAGEVIMALLEEFEQERRLEVNKDMKKKDFGFSDRFTSLNVGTMKFLKDRPVCLVFFSETNSTHVLTVHKPYTQPLTTQIESESRCLLCVWSVREPSHPQHMLVASNDVASVCFHSHLVFAGLIDGLVCLWDLRERSAVHCRSYLKRPTCLLRSPTYISANLEKDKRHFSPVVSVKVLPESNPDDSAKRGFNQPPTQIVTLDEDGLMVIWTVVETKSSVISDEGLAPWGKVRLVQSSHLRVTKAFPQSVQRSVQCRCLSVDSLKPSNLYIGTNTGQVVHCLQTSIRSRPQFYTCNYETKSSITSIEFSRSGHPLFVVGDTGGRVKLYRNMTEKPLLDIAASASTPGSPVKALQWSAVRPGQFFVLDANSCIHVWDLCVSDMCPQMSVPFTPQKITCFSITPHLQSGMLAVSTEAGSVEIYHLKNDFGTLAQKDSEEENTIFNRYITIL